MALRDGRPCVVEYSEMDQASCELTDAQGKLVYGAANICNHFFTLAFVEEVITPAVDAGSILHVARKKIASMGGSKVDGFKLESFIFDVFPLAERVALFEVPREDEFAPVKNAPGAASDTPEAARDMLFRLAVSWVKNAGAVVSEGCGGACEVDTLMSYAGEGLNHLQGVKLQQPFCITGE
ncbi:unnamed protein product [Chrysoparadoxa australica]